MTEFAVDEQTPSSLARDYAVIPSLEEQDVEEGDGIFSDEVDPALESTQVSYTSLIFHTTIFSDKCFTFYGIRVVDGAAGVKFVKFAVFTSLMILLVHCIVRDWLQVDIYGTKTSLQDLWMYEGPNIAMDIIVFFFVGRLWTQQGVDHLAWLLPVVLCNIYFQSQESMKFLQHSFTLYEMHCLWPWQLWVFVCILVPLIIAIVLLHTRRAVQEGIFFQKLLELIFAVLIFLWPYSNSPYFHLHHWFAGWLIGMHCNFDTWWSRATMAWCWGMYINGIAVYGRAPVLTCGYAYFLSTENSCSYLKCYLKGLDQIQHHPNQTNVTDVVPMVPPDWRNCSAR